MQNGEWKKKLLPALFIILLILSLYHIFNQRQILLRIQNEEKQRNEVLQQKIDENKKLQELVNKLNSDEYIEKEARERFNMVKEGEIPVNNTNKSN